MPSIKQPQTESRIRSLLWDSIHSSGWKDHDDFTLRLADAIMLAAEEAIIGMDELKKLIARVKTNFFTVNKVSRSRFTAQLMTDIGPHLRDLLADHRRPLAAIDVFPEIAGVTPNSEGPRVLSRLSERFLQDSLRRILRSKKAAPIPIRKADTAQEVADVELFRMMVKGRVFSFAVVVKGYQSVSGRTLTWKDVAHQVTKAYRGKPDCIILASAKEPVDGLLTNLQEYANAVQNPGLVVFVGPSDLMSLLRANELV